MIEVSLTSWSPAREEQSLAVLSAAADPVRWRLLTELSSAGTRCVCDLQPVAGVAANVLSYHLKVLRTAGLITSARRGRWIDYTLAADAGARLASALPTAPATHEAGE